ncbi:MAG TPA: hypothetical protein VK204_09925 [Nocardioidaceae bacterium]|nr:hypothetical protein [Nocardioidaceae bacterium]
MGTRGYQTHSGVHGEEHGALLSEGPEPFLAGLRAVATLNTLLSTVPLM